MKTKNTFGIPFLFLAMITLTFIGILLHMNAYVMPGRELLYSLTYLSLFFFVFVKMVQLSKIKMNGLAANALLFCLLIIPTTYLAFAKHGLSVAINQLMKATIWALTLMAFYFIGLLYNESLEKSTRITVIFPVLLLLVLGALGFRGNEEYSVSTSAYYLVCLIPFVFTHKDKMWKLVCFAMMVIAVLNSSKRTGFIVVFVMTFVYFYIKNKLQGKQNMALIRTSAIVFVLYLLVMFFSEQFDFSVLDRFSNIAEDQGSGRIDVYTNVLEMIKESDLIAIIFGHGFNQVYFDSGDLLSAHNDFLEVIYDYGILGIILYIYLYRILFRYGKKLFAKKSEYTAAYYSALAIMIPLSLTSHLIIYDTYFLYLCAFFGLAIGQCDKEEMAE